MNTHRPVARVPRVILALEGGDERTRRGVVKFAREHGWALEDCSGDRSWLGRFRTWKGDGIIASPRGDVSLHPMTQFIRYTRAPAVSLQPFGSFFGSACVHPDYREIGRLAALHLASKGYERLGFISFLEDERESEILEGFILGAREVELEVEVNEGTQPPLGLRLETGFLAPSDLLAREAVQNFVRAGFSVPEEIGILGVGNREGMRGAEQLPLSSIDCDFEEIGYQAASALDVLMKGERPESRLQRVSPLGVVERRSVANSASGCYCIR